MEQECAQYIAGYVANRFSNKYPQLTSNIVDQPSNSWTQYISKGSLKMPSHSLERAIEQLEKYFIELHGNSLSKAPNIIKILSNTLSTKIKNLDLPDEVIQCLVRTRTYIRLNNLNKDILNRQFKKFEKNKKQKFTK